MELYGVIGLYMLMNPLLGVFSLTLVLATFLLIECVLETMIYFQLRGISIRVGSYSTASSR